MDEQHTGNKRIKLKNRYLLSMKSRIVLFAFCVALLSSCGNKGNDTGKAPEYAVQELQKTTANLTTLVPYVQLLLRHSHKLKARQMVLSTIFLIV